MKTILSVFLLLILSQLAKAETVFVSTKKHGKVEFTPEAYKEFHGSKEFKKSIELLIKKKKCVAGKKDFLSNKAVHYSYACIIEGAPHSLILFSANQQEENGVNFYVDLLDDELLATIQKKTEYQYAKKTGSRGRAARKKVWYRLTLIDVQDPTIFDIELMDIDSLLNEIEELVADEPVAEPKTKSTGRRRVGKSLSPSLRAKKK